MVQLSEGPVQRGNGKGGPTTPKPVILPKGQASARAALAEQQGEAIGPEWQPCVKLPITVYVREQRPGETHVSTREGITPVQPDDLIMRGVAGEEYPIGRELFNKTYRLGVAEPTPPAEGEVAELVEWLRENAEDERQMCESSNRASLNLERAAELLQQQHPAPVPVSERLPAMVTDGLRVAGDCDEQGRCWAGTRAFVDTSGDRDIDYPPSWELREVRAQDDVWLPAHALPLPQGEAQQ